MEVERVSTVGSRRMTKVFATRLHVVERGGWQESGGQPLSLMRRRNPREPLLVNGQVYRLRRHRPVTV